MEKLSLPLPNSLAAKPSYYPALTGLRAIAAFLVFAHHYYGNWTVQAPSLLTSFLKEGYIGVTVFFTLSGFLIAQSHFQKLTTGQIKLSVYLWKRFARIYPLYLFVLLLHFLLHPNQLENTRQVLMNASLTQAYSSSYIFSGLHPAWSLTIEESFYLLAPFTFWSLTFLTQRQRKTSHPQTTRTQLLTSAILLALCWSLYGIGEQIYVQIKDLFFENPLHLRTYTIFGRLPDFAIGIFLAITISKNKIPTQTANRLFGISLILLFLSLAGLHLVKTAGGMSHGIQSSDGMPYAFLASIGTGVLIIATTKGSSFAQQILGNPLMEYLGKISFAFYLLQSSSIFKDGLLSALQTLIWIPENFLVWLFLLILLSTLGHELIEKPFHRYLTRLSK